LRLQTTERHKNYKVTSGSELLPKAWLRSEVDMRVEQARTRICLPQDGRLLAFHARLLAEKLQSP
jgi:hypothetical protein